MNEQPQSDTITPSLIEAFQKSVLIERWIREVWDAASPEVKAAFASNVVEHVAASGASWTASHAVSKVIADAATEIVNSHMDEVRARAEVVVREKLKDIEKEVANLVEYRVREAVREVFKNVRPS